MGYNATVLGLAGLLNYWPLTDAAGSTSAADAKGSLAATVSGTVTFGVAGGVDGTCATFDGSTGYLNVATPAGLPTGNNPWSYGLWFKTATAPSGDFTGVLGLNIPPGGGPNNTFVFADVRSGGQSLLTGTGTNNVGYTTNTFADGRWHFYGLTYDGTTFRAYFDGYPVGSSVPGTLTLATTAGLDIGWTGNAGNPKFGGQMAGVIACNRALAASEMASLYIAGSGTTPTRIGYWRLNDAAGSTTAADSSGSHPLAASGTVTFGAAGIDGTCATMNGASSLASSGAPTGFPVDTAPWTLEAWFNATSTPNAGYVALCSYGNYGNTGQVCSLTVRSDAKTISIGEWADDLNWTRATAYTDGIWHHAVATFDGTTRILYFDGAQAATDTPSGINVKYGSNPFTVGSGYSGDGKYSGSLQDVAVYNYALPAATVQAHYQTVYPPPLPVVLRPILPAPKVRDRHPLFKGRPGAAWPSREWPNFSFNVSTQATRWGTVPFLGTNFTGGGYNGAGELQWPGRGYVAAPDQVTLWYLGTATGNEFGQNHCNPVATNSIYNESFTDTRGYALRYDIAGTTFAPYLAVGQAGAVYHGVSCGWSLTTGHMYAVAISRDRATGAVNFYAWDYDATDTRAVLTTGLATDTTAAAAGDGIAVINQTWGNFTNYTGALVTAGFAACTWSLADFLAWVADPLGPVRPVHATSPGIILAAFAATRRGYPVSMLEHL